MLTGPPWEEEPPDVLPADGVEERVRERPQVPSPVTRPRGERPARAESQAAALAPPGAGAWAVAIGGIAVGVLLLFGIAGMFLWFSVEEVRRVARDRSAAGPQPWGNPAAAKGAPAQPPGRFAPPPRRDEPAKPAPPPRVDEPAKLPPPAPVPAGLPPPPAPVAIVPPQLAQDKVVRPLPSDVADVAVGGGGRFLILHLPRVRQLAVFDVNEARVVKYLRAPRDDLLLAAGMTKLVVVRRGDKVAERWSLLTFQREAEAPLPIRVPLEAVAMGSASDGPLLVEGCDWPRLGEAFFFDVRAMKKFDWDFDVHNFFPTSPGMHARASANGRVFASVAPQLGGVATCVLSEDALRRYGGQGSFPLPGPDGEVIYAGGGLYTKEMKLREPDNGFLIPAHQGFHYARLEPGRKGLEIRAAGHAGFVVRMPDAEVDGIDLGDRLLPPDKRVHLNLAAKLVITLPGNRDRLVLHRLPVGPGGFKE